jgi:hypothetical protein
MATDNGNDGNGHDEDDYDAPQTNTLVRRGFGGIEVAGENAATQALIAKATADIQARWVMAMRRPRNPKDVRQLITKECERPSFAKEAMYTIPRGGSKITGLSIRFAEVAMRCMGNMSCEAQTLFDSDEERLVRVTATDYETNASWHRDITVKKTIERKQLQRGQRALRTRVNSYGDMIYIVDANDDDVATKEAAMISKAARTAILRLVPGNIQSECEKICEATMAKADARDPDAARNEVFDGFSKLDILPSDLEQWLGHAIERITPHETTELRNLWIAIRDGHISWESAVEEAQKARAKGDRVKAPAPKAQPAAPSAPASNGNGAAAPEKTDHPKTEHPGAQSQKSGGKGTAAAKAALKDKPAAEPKTTPADGATAPKAFVEGSDPEKEPGWMSDSKPKDGYEDRNCAKCGVVIEVPRADPQGAQCYACSQA